MTTSFKISTFRVLLAFVSLAAMSLPCQGARKVRAIFIQPSDPVLEKATLFTGAEYAEIELPQRNLSPEIDLPEGELSVAILSGRLAPDAKVPADAPRIKIPEAWSRCLLLFFPDPSNKTFPARVIPVNASTADFPNGHTLIYNVSSAAIMGKFGDQIVNVLPGKSASVKPPISDSGDYPVVIDCAYPGDTKPTALSRSAWRHNPGARRILFVTPAPGFKVPRVWGVLDRQDGETKKKEK